MLLHPLFQCAGLACFWDKLKSVFMSHSISLAKWSERMEVFTGNCRYSLYSMLKGTLLSCNSGCQVSERRLWDCASSSLGLLNWLCYCRPVQGEGSARESGLCYIRYRAFDCDPPPRGRVFTAALSGEGDLALDPSLCFSQRTTHTITTTTPFCPSRPSHSLLSSQRSFSPPSWSFLLPPLLFLRTHPLGPAGSH